MSVADVYAPEGQLETAITNLLNASIDAFSKVQPAQFQKVRPRAEVGVVLGAGKSNHLAKSEDTGLELDVEDAWDCEISVEVITEAIDAPFEPFIAQVRYIMFRLPALINDGVQLPNHVIYGPMKYMGGSPRYQTDEGFYALRMGFGTIISVQQTRWAQLTAPP